jgi:hypothetical protein
MKLNKTSIQWAINHLHKFSDTDLFPKPVEFKIIYDQIEDVANLLSEVDLGNYKFNPARRFVIPKDEISYRVATQLDPLDNIFLTSIIYQFGNLVEAKRIAKDQEKIFSHRFLPDASGQLFDPNCSWMQFWNRCIQKCAEYEYAIYLDVTDFYNQIYHHVVENQLIEAGFPNPIKKWIKSLLVYINAGVSRGIPIGPHSMHLIAELSLIPIDNSLIAKGFDHCRVIDDMVIFCDDLTEAKIKVYQIAEIFDKQQRLTLQSKKTKIYTAEDFIAHCKKMLEDRPINDNEKEIISIIKKHSNNDPYVTIDIKNLTDSEFKLFSKDLIERIILDYLKEAEPNFLRLRWFLRRMSQIGHPAAVEFCMSNMNSLIPAVSDVCHYLISVGNNYRGDWKGLGGDILTLLEYPIIKSNEYFQISLLNLFSNNEALDHIDRLIALFNSAPSNLKRKIILSAFNSETADWIRELKENYHAMDIWNKRAYLVATSILPIEERKHFLRQVADDDMLNSILIKWAKSQ